MGGDYAPEEVVKGVVMAAKESGVAYGQPGQLSRQQKTAAILTFIAVFFFFQQSLASTSAFNRHPMVRTMNPTGVFQVIAPTLGTSYPLLCRL